VSRPDYSTDHGDSFREEIAPSGTNGQHAPLPPLRPLGARDYAGDAFSPRVQLEGQADEAADDEENQVFYLDDDGEWAVLVPEGVILHAHGPAADNEDEELFYQCEPVEGPDGEPLLRCGECGATISEADLEALTAALADEGDDD
jgi:hypothetical protein